MEVWNHIYIILKEINVVPVFIKETFICIFLLTTETVKRTGEVKCSNSSTNEVLIAPLFSPLRNEFLMDLKSDCCFLKLIYMRIFIENNTILQCLKVVNITVRKYCKSTVNQTFSLDLFNMWYLRQITILSNAGEKSNSVLLCYVRTRY